MNLEIKHTSCTTSIYDGKMEVCNFVTGSRRLNDMYAKKFVKSSEQIEIGLEKTELLKFLNWYVKDEAIRSTPDRLTNIVDRYLMIK